jgi:hypothetical protein
MVKPHIPMLQEDNVRKGFFEPEQFQSILSHMPEHVKPVAHFAYITGGRAPVKSCPLNGDRLTFQRAPSDLIPALQRIGKDACFP